MAEDGTGTRRRGPARLRSAGSVVLVVAVGTACWGLLWVLGWQLPWLFAVVLTAAAAALLLVVRAGAADWETAMPASPGAADRPREPVDARLGMLSRAVAEATATGNDAAGATAPGTVQTTLRSIAERRVAAGTGRQPDPLTLQRLLGDRDAELTAYLYERPPPRVSRDRLNDVVRRIEEL